MMRKGLEKEDMMTGRDRTVMAREMAHPERLPTILEAWKGLEVGETLRIVNDFDPLPLKYMFQGEFGGQYQWSYEKEGPDEWVIAIKKVAAPGSHTASQEDDGERKALKEVLRSLHGEGPKDEIKEVAKGLLRSMDATTLGLLEQEMVHEGVGREEMRKLCDVHLEVMKEALTSQAVKPEPGHPIHTLMEEHKVIKDNLEELRGILGELRSASRLEDVTSQWERLKDIAHHLQEAEVHHQREEQVLFPEMQKRSISEPPQIMLLEHEELRPRKKLLHQVSQEPEKYSYQELVSKVGEAADYLVTELANHIYKEDNILYQMALQAIDQEPGAEMTTRCDQIGSCCFRPVS
jgi:hypothetical protein